MATGECMYARGGKQKQKQKHEGYCGTTVAVCMLPVRLHRHQMPWEIKRCLREVQGYIIRWCGKCMISFAAAAS